MVTKNPNRNSSENLRYAVNYFDDEEIKLEDANNVQKNLEKIGENFDINNPNNVEAQIENLSKQVVMILEKNEQNMQAIAGMFNKQKHLFEKLTDVLDKQGHLQKA